MTEETKKAVKKATAKKAVKKVAAKKVAKKAAKKAVAKKSTVKKTAKNTTLENTTEVRSAPEPKASLSTTSAPTKHERRNVMSFEELWANVKMDNN